MSWYSGIYTWARIYRQSHPYTGFIIARLLNALLVFQFIGLFYSIWVYIWVVCVHFLTSEVQASIYICIYASLCVMSLWSLITTLLTPLLHVPKMYQVSESFDAALKTWTPKEGEKYVVAKSTPEQTEHQVELLRRCCRDKQILLAECDQAGRDKYCYICRHLKPDRSHHCSSCGVCVVKFDHHCPWINHCVCQSNYKYFLLYIFYSTALIIWFLLTSIEGLIRCIFNDNWAEDGLYFGLLVLAMVPLMLFGYFPLGELLIYHFGLISLNETTCEQAKPANLKHDFHADYNQGRFNNFRQIFGWGLWLFPLPTCTEDGMHFIIRYVDTANYKRIIRLPRDEYNNKDENIGVATSPSGSTRSN